MEQQLLTEAGPVCTKSDLWPAGWICWVATSAQGHREEVCHKPVLAGHTAFWWAGGRAWCINFSFRLKYDLSGPISMFKTKTDTSPTFRFLG